MVWSNLCLSCCDNTGRGCIASADMQMLFLSGERIVAHVPLFFFVTVGSTSWEKLSVAGIGRRVSIGMIGSNKEKIHTAWTEMQAILNEEQLSEKAGGDLKRHRIEKSLTSVKLSKEVRENYDQQGARPKQTSSSISSKDTQVKGVTASGKDTSYAVYI